MENNNGLGFFLLSKRSKWISWSSREKHSTVQWKATVKIVVSQPV